MNSQHSLNHPAFAWVTAAILLGALGGCVWLGVRSEWMQAAGAAAVAAVCGLMLAVRKWLPSAFGALIAIAAAVNAAGYILTLWHERTPFDEIVHAFTSFAGMTAIGWLVLRRELRRDLRIFLSAVGIGFAVGIVWEGFEWLIGIIGDRGDTLMDLAMDSVGAVAAGALIVWLAEDGEVPSDG